MDKLEQAMQSEDLCLSIEGLITTRKYTTKPLEAFHRSWCLDCDAIYAKAVESMANLTNNKKGTRNGPFFIFT